MFRVRCLPSAVNRSQCLRHRAHGGARSPPLCSVEEVESWTHRKRCSQKQQQGLMSAIYETSRNMACFQRQQLLENGHVLRSQGILLGRLLRIQGLLKKPLLRRSPRRRRSAGEWSTPGPTSARSSRPTTTASTTRPRCLKRRAASLGGANRRGCKSLCRKQIGHAGESVVRMGGVEPP